MFKTSNSKNKVANRCLKQYYYKYILKYRRRIKSRALLVGSLVHECLESYFRDGNYTTTIKEWREKEFKKMFKEEQALHSDIIPLVKVLLRGYISNWKSLNLEMEWVEKNFEYEIAPGIILVGKIDGKARDDKSRPWLVEHKTCRKMPGEEVRIHDTQGVLYTWVLDQMGESTVGIIWDYLRTKLPARPELLKSGGLSTRKNIDTTYEVYLREIKKHGFDVRGYREILGELKEKRDSFYRQVKLPFNSSLCENVMSDLVVNSRQIIFMERECSGSPELWPRNLTRDCSWCDYKTLCHAELRGEDVSFLLKHDYVENKGEKKKSSKEKLRTRQRRSGK